MKGTAMTVVMGATVMLVSASACNFTLPRDELAHELPWEQTEDFSFSCDELSESCCHGLQDFDHMALGAQGRGKPQGGKRREIRDLVGTCGRADQVELYNCAVKTAPELAPAGKGGKKWAKKWWTAIIQANGCHSVQTSPGTDGSGHCSLYKGKGKGTFEVDGVSTGCCEAGNNAITAGDVDERTSEDLRLYQDALCGMIGACGKEDQKSILRSVKGMMKGGGPHPAELELLEMFNMTDVAPQQMLATILTSGAEDEVIEDEAVTEDEATEDSSPIVTGILGFVAGAAVTGLGVTALRRSSPSSKDQYNEIVA